ncbi:hypothetical protein FCM35_KLT08293 [Carex littledalei]|uniref:Uncharacterized protein n=1 Tax=Carex littledalei TaxID=544730 RepID=A0A833QXC0_9POAL|nr:hypothetical protein FCM35_KLT08293 [Carex littledalei]
MVSYNNIRHEGLCADMATFVTLASSCTGHECSVHAHAIRSGFGADMIVENAILDSVLRDHALYGIWSNGFTFSSVSKSWSNLADISLGRCIYGAIIKLGS